MSDTLSKVDINTGLRELDSLCKEEYRDYGEGGLRSLLADSNTEMACTRLQRIIGVLLKRRFAVAQPLGDRSSVTGSTRAWKWAPENFEDTDLQGTAEFIVLDRIRQALPDLGRLRQPTWEDLIQEVDTERGLYKVLTLWIIDVLNKRQRRSINDYLGQNESAEFEARLDVADLVSQTAIAGVLASIIPQAGIVVGLVLIGARYGQRKITDPIAEADERPWSKSTNA